MNAIRMMATGDLHICPRYADDVTYALDQIHGLVEEHRPDIFLLGGDCTDVRGMLDPWTVRTFRSWVASIAEHCGHVYIIPGNHEISLSGGMDNLTAMLHRDEWGGPSVTQDFQNVTVIGNDYEWLSSWQEHSYQLGFVFIPNPSEKISPEEARVDIQQSLISLRANMGDDAQAVALFHGATQGASRGNEQEMPRGHEVIIPLDAFDGFDLAHGQHIHQHSITHSPDGCPVIHGGAVCSLTYGDKVEPVLHEYRLHGRSVDFERHPLQPRCQRITVSLTTDDLREDVSIHWSAGRKMSDAISGIEGRVKLRLVAKLPEGLLHQLDEDWRAQAQGALGLDDLKLIKEVVDSHSGLETFTPQHKIDLVETVREWAEMNKERAQLADQIVEIAKSVEELREAGELEDPCFDLEPVHMRLTNWKQWGMARLDLEDLGQVTVLSGPNASGKSNLLEAEAFALYGKMIKGGNLVDAIKQGEDVAQIKLDFKSHGTDFRVTRELKRVTSKGVDSAVQQVFLYWWDSADGTIENITGNSIKETEAKIAELVGPWSFYRLTRYASERDLEALVEATPHQLAGIMEEMLDLNLTDRDAVAKQWQAQAEADLAFSRGQVESIDDKIEKASAAQNELNQVLAESKELVEANDLAEQALEQHQEKQEARKEELSELKGELKALRARLEEYQGSAQDLLDARDELSSISAEHKALDQQVQELSSQVPAGGLDRSLVDGLDADVDRLGKDLSQLEAEQKKADEALSLVKVAGQEQRAKVESLKDSIHSAKRQKQILKEVPCKGKAVQILHPNPEAMQVVDCSSCQFLTEAHALDVDALQLEHHKADATLHQLREDFADRDREAEMAAADVKSKKAELQRALDLRKEATTLEKRRSELKVARANRDQAAKFLSRQKALVEALEEKNAADLAKQKDLKAQVEKQQQVVGSAEAEVEKLEHNRVNLVTAVESGKQALQQMDQRQTLLSYVIKEAAKAHEARKEAERKQERLQKKLEALGLYRQAMGKHGISFLLLKNAVPRFQRLANAFLEPLDLRYRLTTASQVSAGWRDKLHQTFTDGMGSHPVCESSGFQRKILGMALRIALAKTHAELTGSRLFQIIQDEGWGAFDHENLGKASAMLKGLMSEIQGRMIIITHITAMQEVADTKLLVAPGVDGPELKEEE